MGDAERRRMLVNFGPDQPPADNGPFEPNENDEPVLENGQRADGYMPRAVAMLGLV